MYSEETVGKVLKNGEEDHQMRTICLHAFSDLSRVPPTMFVYLLKECYVYGTRKATLKFHALQQQVLKVLHNSPKPGPATFVVRCLYVLPILGPRFTEGFSHLVISAFRRLQTIPADLSKARSLAAHLFLHAIAGCVILGEGVLMKLLQVFDVGLKNVEEALCGLEVNDHGLDTAKAFIEPYILGLIESHSFMMAVTLLEHFSMRQFDQSFLLRMMQENQFKAAEKWATFMGKQMLHLLVQKYIDMKMLKNASEIVKNNNLQEEFPDVYRMCKESSLKKLAEKGCWDIAEARTRNDRQLVEYLVYLAMEADYSEKVDELCERYSLKSFMKPKVPEPNPPRTQYLHLNELDLKDVVWVDEVSGLLSATSHIKGCKVVGLDCEWKPNYEKGSKPNKVSIMQIASEKIVFIIDLIKLSEEEPNVLDSCLKHILHSPRILKLGYSFHCDLKQLSHSYGELECFQHYEMLLDIQNVFKERKGGLSGLVKKILGASLNKTIRNSNWEQRPLTRNQMEYAALDAAVLVHIFCRVHDQLQPLGFNGKDTKIEWKSYIVSRMDSNTNNTEKPKQKKKPKRKMEVENETVVS